MVIGCGVVQLVAIVVHCRSDVVVTLVVVVWGLDVVVL